jgi:hypothetical protein
MTAAFWLQNHFRQSKQPLSRLLIISVVAFWQLALLNPQQTFIRAKKGRDIAPEIVVTDAGLAVEVLLPQNFSERDIPKALRELRRRENTNDLIQDPTEFGGEIKLDALGPYEPKKGVVFYVPYIPLPTKQLGEYLVGSNMSDELRKALIFEHNGVEYVRFFIHPSRTSSYQDLIDKHGIVRDEFLGFLGGSPRSIYTFHPTDSRLRPFQVKASLHFRVNDDLKINIPSKAARSHAVNEFFASISDEIKDEYGFDFLPESLQLLPKGKAAATFYREIPNELLDYKNFNYVPGYYLSSHGAQGQPPILTQILKKYATKHQKIKAAAELLRSLLRLNVYLMFEEGLKGELHEQNVYFELDDKNRLTGRLLLKDLDSFRTDIELRLRKDKSIDVLRYIYKPFVYAKFNKASGWSTRTSEEPLFDQISVVSYISHTFGFSFCQVLECTKRQLNMMFDLINHITAEEIENLTGEEIPNHQIGRPKDFWLSRLAEHNRDELNEAPPALTRVEKTKAVQHLLRQKYRDLQKKKRTSATLANLYSPNVYFVFHHEDGVIEARHINPHTKIDRSVGFGVFYPQENADTRQFMTEYRRRLKKAKSSPRPSCAQVLRAG